MDPFLHLFKILLIISTLFNFYLIHSSLQLISVQDCFKANEEYKGYMMKEIQKSEECLAREELEQMKKIKPIHTTRSFPKYEVELNKKHDEPCRSLEEIDATLKNDSFVRNCITGDIIGKVNLNVIKTLNIHFNFGNIQSTENSKERLKSFEDVYESRAWGKNWDTAVKGMSASGEGSTLQWTQELSAILHATINTIKKTKALNSKVRILDVPCGDMVWMKRFLSTRDDVEYTGIDIVPELIQQHQTNNKHKPWSFFLKDIVEVEELAQYDVIISRMFFNHLYNADILKVLKLFSNSKSSYLITSTFPNLHTNKELNVTPENPGRYRPVNLQMPPFSLTKPVCYSKDGPLLKGHKAALWNLPLLFHDNCNEINIRKRAKTLQNKIRYFTCSEIEFLKHL